MLKPIPLTGRELDDAEHALQNRACDSPFIPEPPELVTPVIGIFALFTSSKIDGDVGSHSIHLSTP